VFIVKSNAIKEWYQQVIKPYLEDAQSSIKSSKYTWPLTILLLVAAGGIVGYRGYSWWIRQREQTAQKAFSECLGEYHQALYGQGGSWSNVAMLFNIGYENNSSSKLAPYFLVFYADALLRQGKKDEGLIKFDEAIKMIPADSPLLYLYKTKQALVQLDSEEKETGLAVLKELAVDEKNIYRDEAMYYHGLYYWDADNMHEAKTIWQQLADEFKQEKYGASPWASLAKDKLDQIP